MPRGKSPEIEQERRRKISEAQKRMWTPEMRAKARAFAGAHWAKDGSREKRAQLTRELWKDPARREAWRAERKRRWQNPVYKSETLRKSASHSRQHPNKLEQAYIDLLDANVPGEWIFTGGGKRSAVVANHVPDFMHATKQKIIELYGTYWHKNDNPEDIIAEYRLEGYEAIVIWENEPKELGLSKILAFMNS